MTAPTSAPADRPLRHLWAWVLAYALINLIAWRSDWPMWVL